MRTSPARAVGPLLPAAAALAVVVLAAVLLAGCGSSGPKAAPAGSPPTGSAAPTATSSAGDSTVSTAPTSTAQASSMPASTAPTGIASTSSAASPSGSAIRIPPYLCDATDQAQNAADAYMGALSAGNEKQATACVLPGTVPAATTRSLLASQQGTAVYLPRDGVDGPSVFGYAGNSKSIDVTVTKQRDGRFWVTRVAVRTG